MALLDISFYLRDDVVQIARELIGKVLVTEVGGKLTSGIITETEAYKGVTDRASHAFAGRRTHRTEIMYATGGIAYVYLCYGIHCLFNVVTNRENIPHAVLIRNIVPLEGLKIMHERRKIGNPKKLLTGPGTLTKALGIDLSHNCKPLSGHHLKIEDRNIEVDVANIKVTPRIGVDYAGADAALPYRFVCSSFNM